MSKSSKASQPLDFDFELPVPDPGFNPDPPKGTWEDGYNLSLMGLEMIKDRPEIWAERERRRCDVEFKM
jgi:hypothetical protein